MADHLYLVLSSPPEGVSAEEYDRWYHDHVRENIAQPGFHGARRYEVQPTRGDGMPQHTHLAVYDYDGDLQGMGERLDRRIEAGEIVLPPWFGGIRFQSMSASALEPHVEAPGA
jgi:hypothetical protein